jgi:hypothetical protein
MSLVSRDGDAYDSHPCHSPRTPGGQDMKHEDADRLLDRIGMLRHPCDLDLLLFVARHPRTLITSKQIAAWLGYELKQIADSLEVLLEGGLRTRRQNPTHAARRYGRRMAVLCGRPRRGLGRLRISTVGV